MKKQVMEVVGIEVGLWPGEVPAWRVRAIGIVPTVGWTEAQLVPSASPPSDGEVHLDFVAKPPGGIMAPVVTDIDASTTLPARPDVTRLVVHSRTNELTRALPGDKARRRDVGGGESPTPFRVIVQGGGGDMPTPFKVIVEGGGETPNPFQSLQLDPRDGLARPVISAEWMVGMKLRVVHPGDVVTADFDDERVNVHVDDAERIVRVTIG